DHERATGGLHTPIAGDIQRGTHPQRLGPVREPQAQIENRVTQVEHGAASGLVAPSAPSELGPAGTEDMPAAANALDLPELSALDEAADDLHVGAVPVVERDHQDPLLL